MQDTTESIKGDDGQPRGILSFSDLRMTWRAVNLRGNLAYFCTRDEAAEWLRAQPALGYRGIGSAIATLEAPASPSPEKQEDWRKELPGLARVNPDDPFGKAAPASPSPGLREAVNAAVEYLDAIERNMLANDVDVLLDGCAPPSLIAEHLRAALAADKGERDD